VVAILCQMELAPVHTSQHPYKGRVSPGTLCEPEPELTLRCQRPLTIRAATCRSVSVYTLNCCTDKARRAHRPSDYSTGRPIGHGRLPPSHGTPHQVMICRPQHAVDESEWLNSRVDNCTSEPLQD
jgi:hypothetical protein